MAVSVERVTEAPVSVGFDLLATVKSQRSTTVQPQVDGNLTQIFVRSGDKVQQGQALMQIEASRQLAAVENAKAALASRKAGYEFAKDQFERMKQVQASGGASAQDLDTARAQLETSRAELSATEATLSSQQLTLDYYRVTAPLSGTVGDIPVHRGDRVTPMTLLTTIEQNEGLEIYAEVPIERASDVHVGSKVYVLDDQGAVLFESKIHFVSPHVAEDTQTVLCKAALLPSRRVLRANTSVPVRITTSEAPRIRIPTTAIVRMNGQPFVYVVAREGASAQAKMVPVSIGELFADRFMVTSGLKAGDELVTTSVQKLRDATPIAPSEPASAPAAATGTTK